MTTDVTVTGSAGHWQARAGADLVGTVRALVRPDQRCHLFFRDCRPEAYGPMVGRAAAELDRDLHVVADEPGSRQLLTRLGFTLWRTQRYYRVPADPARLRLPPAGPPTGIDLVSAAEVETDVDATNRAANALVARCGGVHTGDSYHLVLPHR